VNDQTRTKAQLMRELEQARRRQAAAEEALREMQSWFRCFVEAASDGFLLLDSNLRIVDVQRRELAVASGIDAQSVLGKPLEHISPGSETDGRLEQFREVLRTGRPLFIEDYVPTRPPPGYENRHLSLKAFKVGDKLVGLISDITQRRMTEETLRDSEARYRLLADNVKDIIWTLDNQAHITYISPSVKLVTGYEVDDLIGRHVSVLMPGGADVEPIDVRLLPMGKWRGSASQSWTVAQEVVTRAGDTIWTESTLSYLRDEEGRISGLLGVTRDIHDRKKAHELFRTLAENSPVGVYIAQDRRFEFVNRPFQEYVGRTAAELSSLNPASFILPQDRKGAREKATRMLKGHRRSPYEFRFIGKGGKVRWAIERVASVEFRGKRAVLGNLMDVTERKRNEEALAKSEKELRLLSKRILQIQEEERGSIARDLHDQLGQEIFVIMMEVESLIERARRDTETRRRMVALKDMIDRLRSTSRRIAASTRPAFIDELGLMKAIQLHAEDFERRSGVSCPVQVPAGEVSVPRATAIVAFRIVQEALMNVWKHAGASQVDVTVRLNRTTLSIAIADNGVGMAVGPHSDSTSLGLRGMAERAKLVGGSLRVKSVPGRGCTVLARLPVKAERTFHGGEDYGE
jgi:PAS domain S-box-containing protein